MAVVIALAAIVIAALLSGMTPSYAPIGVSATVRDVSVIVFVDTHAWDAVATPENRNVPLVEADHAEMSVMVSEVPPFVHVGVPDIAIDPDDGAANVALDRVVDPTEMLLVPAAPGAPVWIWK
jgi:hypothetical protein